jgi:hypothetical protein
MQAVVVGQLTAVRPPETGVQTPAMKSTPPLVTQSDVGQLIALAPAIAVTAQVVPSVVDSPVPPYGPTAAQTVADEQLTPVAYPVEAKLEDDHEAPPSVVFCILPALPATWQTRTVGQLTDQR